MNRLVPISRLALASKVARVFSLRSVTLDRSTCERLKLIGDASDADMQVDVRDRTEITITDTTLAAVVRFRIHTGGDKTKATGVFVLEAAFLVEYQRTGQEVLTEEEFQAFSEVNPVYNAWPYLREFVSSLTGRMGLPSLFLESLVIVPSSASDSAPKRRRAKKTARSKEEQSR